MKTKINSKVLMSIVGFWFILTLINYYYTPYFILPVIWTGVSLFFGVFTIALILRLIKERKKPNKLEVQKLIVFSLLFFLTFFDFFTHGIIEKIDWMILYNKRIDIIEKVKNNELNPNVSWNDRLCQLQFEFPVVSNGGNDIIIKRNNNIGTCTVVFWVYRNFFSSPSTHFIYTNDPEEINRIENKIKHRPSDNWKIEENWYRTFGYFE
jgi:hypothetical protein